MNKDSQLLTNIPLLFCVQLHRHIQKGLPPQLFDNMNSSLDMPSVLTSLTMNDIKNADMPALSLSPDKGHLHCFQPLSDTLCTSHALHVLLYPCILLHTP